MNSKDRNGGDPLQQELSESEEGDHVLHKCVHVSLRLFVQEMKLRILNIIGNFTNAMQWSY